jgi:peptidoglycan hydrolase-like protein with peptidoglycan-binding domain
VGATKDGIMGPQTRKKIKEWQGKNNLTKDGIWGTGTENMWQDQFHQKYVKG